MGTHEDIRTARYPEGHVPPRSTLPNIIGMFLGSLGAVAVLLFLLGNFSDLSVRGMLPAAIGPLLVAAVGFLIRRWTLGSKASDGLYFLQVRSVDGTGHTLGRWRSYWALSMPGLIICRPRWTGEDRELSVRGISEPVPVPVLRSLVTADGPVHVMRVDTGAGPMEFRGRPEYLYELAAGAAAPPPTTGSTRA